MDLIEINIIKVLPIFSRDNRPVKSVIRATNNRFLVLFTLVGNAHVQGRRIVRTEEFIAAVEQTMKE